MRVCSFLGWLTSSAFVVMALLLDSISSFVIQSASLASIASVLDLSSPSLVLFVVLESMLALLLSDLAL